MGHLPAGDGWLSHTEAVRIARQRFAKRRAELRLGRYTAKRALAHWLGLDHSGACLARIEIDRAPDGAPLPRLDGLPAEASMSMTDRADWAVCLVGPPDVGLGCDLELVEPRSEAFVRDYLTPAEQRLVEREPGPGERHVAANLVWSAKESGLKVLRTGLRRDTRSVEVRFGDTSDDGWRALEVLPSEGGRFPGWWRRYGPFLLTCAASRQIGPPRSLESPPALATAAPGESWRESPA
jgi:4'-phosphopantetheinyl transferase